jgi:hypothetical protein
MASLVGTPQASNSEGLAGLSTPISYSKETGLALQLANMLASAGQVVPYMRKLTPAQFTSGTYGGIKPDGYTPAAYKLSMLEMPETIAVYDDVLKVCQPVMVYQVGTPAQLITSDFPIRLQTGNFTIGGKAVPAVSEGQSVLLRFYKNANIKINWAGSNVANNGLTDEVITTTTELAFVVTYLNGTYKVAEWLSPNFITTQLSTLKTAKKNNFASIVNELFDKIPAPVTLPSYDTTTLKLANNILSVILAPQANAATILNDALYPVQNFARLDEEGIGITAIGEARIVIWDYTTANAPFIVDNITNGAGIVIRASDAEYYILATTRTEVQGDLGMWVGISQVVKDEVSWHQLIKPFSSFAITNFKSVGNILGALKPGEIASIHTTGSSVANGPISTTFTGLGFMQRGMTPSYVQAVFFVTNTAAGANLQSYIGILYSAGMAIKWIPVGGANETVIIQNFAQNIDSPVGNFEITPLVEVSLNDKLQIQGCFGFGNGQPTTSFNEVFRLTGEGAAILITSAVSCSMSDKSIIILEYNGGDSILVRYDLEPSQVEDSATLEIFKITKYSG